MPHTQYCKFTIEPKKKRKKNAPENQIQISIRCLLDMLSEFPHQRHECVRLNFGISLPSIYILFDININLQKPKPAKAARERQKTL